MFRLSFGVCVPLLALRMKRGSERQHLPTLDPTDAHAQLLSGSVDTCKRFVIVTVSDGKELYLT